jgi:hypothetical protein
LAVTTQKPSVSWQSPRTRLGRHSIERVGERVKFAQVDGENLHAILQIVGASWIVLIFYSLTLAAYIDSLAFHVSLPRLQFSHIY